MILTIDIGNTHIFSGIFEGEKLIFRFRYDSRQPCSSDQLGVFFWSVLQQNNIDPKKIQHIAISSVVPELDYSVQAACIKYFQITPFILKAGVKTGLIIKVKNPAEMGADRIANAVAAIEQIPNKNIILVDFGTATTVCSLSKNKEYLGGAILPGIKTAMLSLAQFAAKLPPVEIKKPDSLDGRSTEEQIQIGLYYGHLGSVRELIAHISQYVLQDSQPVVIATGGFTHLFRDEKIFDVIIPDLALHGLRIILNKNQEPAHG